MYKQKTNCYCNKLMQFLILTFFIFSTYGCVTISNPETMRKPIIKAKEKVIPALVHLTPIKPVYRLGKKEEIIAVGSGFIISPEGYIVTNEHVVGESKKVKCVLSNKDEVEAEVIGTDPFTDVAVLKLPSDRTYPYIKMADSDKIESGEIVLALGSPHGLSRSISMGIVSMTERNLDVSTFNNFIQTDASINPGNSGGPLVNLKGEVIGINARMVAGAENLGFAIPINIAKEVVNQIITKGKVERSWFGLTLQEMKAITEDNSKQGVVIADVELDSPAYRSGIRPGDILIAVNNEKVHARFIEDLPKIRKKIADLPLNQPSEFTIQRGDKQLTFALVPELYSPYQGQEIEFAEWGFTASEITSEMIRRLKIPVRKGIYISGVQEGSIAKISGLTAGDVILEFDKAPVSKLEQFIQLYRNAIESKKPLVLLFVQRGVVTRFVLIKQSTTESISTNETEKELEEK